MSLLITWASLCAYFGTDPSKTRHLVRCPAHEDNTESLSIRQTLDGKILIHCFAGCTFAAVAALVRDGAAKQAQTVSRWRPSASEDKPARDWTKLMLPLPEGDLSFGNHLARKIGVGSAEDYLRLYPSLRLIPSALGTPAIAVYDPLIGGQALPLFKDTFVSHSGRKFKKYTIPGTNCKVPLFLPRSARQEKGDIEVFVAEGISDWLALASQDASENHTYTALLGAAQNLDVDVAERLQKIKTYCMFDSDPAGEAGARKLQMVTGCIRLAPPLGHKDWRDYLQLTRPYQPLYR